MARGKGSLHVLSGMIYVLAIAQRLSIYDLILPSTASLVSLMASIHL